MFFVIRVIFQNKILALDIQYLVLDIEGEGRKLCLVIYQANICVMEITGGGTCDIQRDQIYLETKNFV